MQYCYWKGVVILNMLSEVSVFRCGHQQIRLFHVLGNCAVEASLKLALRSSNTLMNDLLYHIAGSLNSSITAIVESASNALSNISGDGCIRAQHVATNPPLIDSMVAALSLESPTGMFWKGTAPGLGMLSHDEWPNWKLNTCIILHKTTLCSCTKTLEMDLPG